MTQTEVNERAQMRIDELIRQMKAFTDSLPLVAVAFSVPCSRLQKVIAQLTSFERAIFERHLKGAHLNIAETDAVVAQASLDANLLALAKTITELAEHQTAVLEAALPKNGVFLSETIKGANANHMAIAKAQFLPQKGGVN